MSAMQISAKTDYAVRVMLELAAHGPELVKAELLISHQGLPRKFVEAILAELRRAGLVRSHRGAEGGYELARSPPRSRSVRSSGRWTGRWPRFGACARTTPAYDGAAKHLPDVWVAVRASLRRVLDETTLAQVLDGQPAPAGPADDRGARCLGSPVNSQAVIHITSVDIDCLTRICHDWGRDRQRRRTDGSALLPPFWQVSFWTTRRAGAFDQRCRRF